MDDTEYNVDYATWMNDNGLIPILKEIINKLEKLITEKYNSVDKIKSQVTTVNYVTQND